MKKYPSRYDCVRNLHLAAIFLCFSAASFAQNYTFTKIADTAPESPFAGPQGLAISPDGTVLMAGARRDGADGIYIFRNAQLTRLPDLSGVRHFAPFASMNTEGTIATSLTLFDGSGGVFRIAGGRATPAHAVPAPYVEAPYPRINESGDIAFGSGLVGISTRIVRVSGANATTIADLSGNLAGNRVLSQADINNRGQVAFTAGGGDPSTGGLYLYTNGTLSRVVPDPLAVSLDAPAINDAGVVFFLGFDTGSARGGLRVYYPDGRVQTVAAAGSFFHTTQFREFRHPVINQRTHVAFVGTHESSARNERGIYILRDAGWEKVIAAGDPLFGSTVISLGVPPGGDYLDDSDRITFNYGLANGLFGVALAIPPASGGGSPSVSSNSILNAASFVPAGQAGHAVSPGAVVSIFGSQFVDRLALSPGSPHPTSLGGLSVTVNGAPVPLFFAAPNQVNAQIPYSATGASAEVRVQNGSGQSATQTVQLTASSPALYTTTQRGSGQAIAIHAGTLDLAAAAGSVPGARPARAGDVIVLYVNGMGAVNPPIEAGRNSCDPDGRCAADYSNVVLRRVVTQPVLQIGQVTVPAENILFAGLAPEFAGLYQINFTMPPGVAPGDAVPVVIRQGNNASRSDVTIAVE